MFRQEVRKAHKNENYITVQRFYMRLFDSFSEICALFKVFNIFFIVKYRYMCINVVLGMGWGEGFHGYN